MHNVTQAELDEARGLLDWISGRFSDAVQADCENGVKWLNERAAANYLKDAPDTLAAIRETQDRIDAFLAKGDQA